MSDPAQPLPLQEGTPPLQATQEALFTRDFLLLCLSTFLFSGSMFLLFAVLPIFVVQELNGLESQVGLIMGAFAVSAVLARPASGRIVDRWSRKAGLSLGSLIYCVAPALYTQVTSVPVMLGLRFFHGIGIAVYTTAGSVLVADLAPPSRRGEAMGYYGMALNLSMAIGPALGAALIGPIGFAGLFWLSAALALASLLLTQLIHEPRRSHSHRHPPTDPPPLFSRAAVFPGFIALCMTVTFGAVVSFLPLFVRAHHLGNPGLFFTIYSVVVIATRPLAGRWSDRFGRSAIIIPGMFMLAISMIILAHSTSMAGLVWTAILQGLGFGGVHPSIMALVVDRSTIHDRGPALATLMAAFDIGVGLSAIGLGIVLEHTNFTVMYLCAAGVAFIGTGAAMAAVRKQE
ncbi:MAG: MFS transporter [Thermodesulfobacteriota bacterium]